MPSGKSSPRRKRTAYTKKGLGISALTADLYTLYQQAVQTPEVEVAFLEKAFRKHRSRQPRTLREDFCGTGLLCAEWVRGNANRTAVGVDLDPVPLAWGKTHNIAPLGAEASRVELRRANVLDAHAGSHDVVVAFNFSYWIFQTRAVMLEYFRAVRESLAPDGMFVLDFFGGWEAQQVLEEKRQVSPGGFTYIWDQAEFNPIDNSTTCHIHFRFRDGSEIRRAFSYHWRLWSLIEIQELLAEAGFARREVYWEDEDDEGEGTGVWRPKKSASNDPGWLAYVVALK